MVVDNKKKIVILIVAVGALLYFAKDAFIANAGVALYSDASAKVDLAKQPANTSSATTSPEATEEILARLMKYENRILSLEGSKKPSPFVPTTEEVGRDQGGEATGKVFVDGEVASGNSEATGSLGNQSVASLAVEKNKLEQRVADLENSLAKSEEMANELKKIRPSSAELATFDDQLKAKDQEIAALHDRIAELERSNRLPQLKGGDRSLPPATEQYDAAFVAEKAQLANEHGKLADQSLTQQNQIAELKQKIEKYQLREQTFSNQLAQARSDVVNAQDELARTQKTLETLRQIERERDQLQTQLISSRDIVAQLEQQLEQRKNVEVNNSFLRKQADESKSALEQAERQLRAAAQMQPKLEQALRDLDEQSRNRAQLAKERDELERLIKQLRQELAQAIEDKKEIAKRTESSLSEAQARQQEVTALNDQLSRAITEGKECSEALATNERRLDRVGELEKALIKAKNDLLLKDTEIRTLSAQASRREQPAPVVATRNTLEDQLVSSKRQQPLARSTPPAPLQSQPNDVLLVEVLAKKVNLRSGPGAEHSPVMQVEAGNRLTVESKEGDWYRVLTPTGSRAYILSDVVRPVGNSLPSSAGAKPLAGSEDLVPFGKDEGTVASSAGSDEESRAFEALKSAIQGK